MTTEKHTEIILHECTVLSLKEDGSSLIMQLDGAVLSPAHPSNSSGRFLDVHPVQLILMAVITSEVWLWDDAKKNFDFLPERVPFELKEILEPERPMIEPDGVMVWVINGFDASSGRWLEWRIRFREFQMTWDLTEEIKTT